jgi:hypothetical protein
VNHIGYSFVSQDPKGRENMSNVTARPWKIGHGDGLCGDVISWQVFMDDEECHQIPISSGMRAICVINYGNLDGNAEANAAHIVKCVNYHERLVGHLDRLCAHADCGDVPPWIEEWDEVQAILAELDKEPTQ